MEKIYKETYFLSAGEANPEQEMSLPELVAKLIDIATLHANHLGIGNPSMKDIHAGWVLSRLTIEMQSYPHVNDKYSISTWIESFNRHFSERAFCIMDENGKVLGYARSVWMVMDTLSHTNVGLAHFSLPAELISGEKPPIPRQAKHIPIINNPSSDELKGCLPATHLDYDYRFKYCDLDSYRHVNTVRYVILLLNRFSLEEFDKTFVRRLELSFLHEARYNMETSLSRSDSDNDNDVMSCFYLRDKSDNSPLLFARLFRANRDLEQN